MANEALMAKSRAESVEEEQTRTGLKKERKKHFALPFMRLGLRILMRGLVVSSAKMFSYILNGQMVKWLCNTDTVSRSRTTTFTSN